MSGQAEAMHRLFEHWGWPIPRSDERWCTIRCQIHDDQQASARVNMEQGAYICLACGAHAGSPFGLIKLVEHLENREVYQLMEKLGVASGSGERAASGPKRPWKGRTRRSGRVSGWREAKA